MEKVSSYTKGKRFTDAFSGLDVYVGIGPKDEKVIIKTCSKPEFLTKFQAEEKFLQRLQCDNVPKYIASCRTIDNEHQIIMEFCGQPIKELVKRGKKFTAEEVIRSTVQLMVSVEWIFHQRNVAHCDILPKNILYLKEKSKITIIDFDRSIDLTTADEKERTDLIEYDNKSMYEVFTFLLQNCKEPEDSTIKLLKESKFEAGKVALNLFKIPGVSKFFNDIVYNTPLIGEVARSSEFYYQFPSITQMSYISTIDQLVSLTVFSAVIGKKNETTVRLDEDINVTEMTVYKTQDLLKGIAGFKLKLENGKEVQVGHPNEHKPEIIQLLIPGKLVGFYGSFSEGIESLSFLIKACLV
jgi:serine/threonine protein kinase